MDGNIIDELRSHVTSQTADAILNRYSSSKTAYRSQDWEKCLLQGGKFCEEVMKAIHYIRTGEKVSSISLESESAELLKRHDIADSLRLLIPRAVRVLYDLRSRRGGAHTSFNPNAMDSLFSISIVDWILAELVHLLCTSNPEESMKFATNVTAKAIPFAERFGEDVLVLLKGLSASKEIALILYAKYPERIKTGELFKWMNNHTKTNIRISLGNLQKARLVHTNSDGTVLTAAGIKFVEDEIIKKDIISVNSLGIKAN
jgi:hypothetical protein